METTKDQTGTKASRAHRFVASLEAASSDKGLMARLRRADNPATEYQCWEYLGRFGVDLENENERLPFGLIAAAFAKSKAPRAGKLRLGEAIARCYDDGNKNPQAVTRLRRLLACRTTTEACSILRSIFALINSRVSEPLNYQEILGQLLWFGWDGARTKARWAQEFFSHGGDEADVARGEQ
jgi:CRISPR system Cascade subunit CasB